MPTSAQPADNCTECDGIEANRDYRKLSEVQSCPAESGTLCYKMLFFYGRDIAKYVTTLTIKARVVPPDDSPTEILSKSYDTGMVVH
jgi:hypothetical protein